MKIGVGVYTEKRLVGKGVSDWDSLDIETVYA